MAGGGRQRVDALLEGLGKVPGHTNGDPRLGPGLLQAFREHRLDLDQAFALGEGREHLSERLQGQLHAARGQPVLIARLVLRQRADLFHQPAEAVEQLLLDAVDDVLAPGSVALRVGRLACRFHLFDAEGRLHGLFLGVDRLRIERGFEQEALGGRLGVDRLSGFASRQVRRPTCRPR